MKTIRLVCSSVLCVLLFATAVRAEIFYANSQQEFDDAHDNAAMNDSIIWEPGSYSDIFMDISNDNLFIAAETSGGTVFTGASRVRITSNSITLQGFQFVGGDIGTNDVINTSGSYNHFTEINIRAYRSYKYLVIREACQYVSVTYCNFENRLNLDDKNILWGLAINSPAINATLPGYAQLPQFEGMDAIDIDILFDLMGQERPQIIEEKDLGCNEFPHNTLIQPIATEENTGPGYNTSMVTGVNENSPIVNDLIRVSPNPAFSQITITLDNQDTAEVKIDIFDLQGRKIRTIFNEADYSGLHSISLELEFLSAGMYTIHASSKDHQTGIESIQVIKFIKH